MRVGVWPGSQGEDEGTQPSCARGAVDRILGRNSAQKQIGPWKGLPREAVESTITEVFKDWHSCQGLVDKVVFTLVDWT